MLDPLRIAVVIASAVAYALSFPPVGLGPLVLVAVGGLIWALKGCSQGMAFVCGLVWGVLAFGIGLSWFWNIFHVMALPLWGVLALFPAVFGALVALARQRGLQGVKLALYIALAWTGTDFVRCEIMPLRLPWLHVGLALEPWPLVSWIGVYGLGFVAVSLVAAASLRKWRVLVMVLAVLGSAALFETRFFKAPLIPVAAVQAETAPLSTYLELSKQVPQGTQLIVWPEYAVPKDIRQSPSELEAIQQIAASKNALIVFGTQTRLEGVKWQNTALTVDGNRVIGEHGKNHTVHLFEDGERGPTATAFETSLGKIGTPICFDCDFHDVVRRMTADGAEFFAVPSMDAVSWGEKQHIQHSQLFRVRAAENRRSMIVAASSGVSQIIDQNGHATKSLGALKQGVLSGGLTLNRELTFFTRHGWLTPWLALVALVIWTLWLKMFKAVG